MLQRCNPSVAVCSCDFNGYFAYSTHDRVLARISACDLCRHWRRNRFDIMNAWRKRNTTFGRASLRNKSSHRKRFLVESLGWHGAIRAAFFLDAR
jgi:hypothetical protein